MSRLGSVRIRRPGLATDGSIPLQRDLEEDPDHEEGRGSIADVPAGGPVLPSIPASSLRPSTRTGSSTRYQQDSNASNLLASGVQLEGRFVPAVELGAGLSPESNQRRKRTELALDLSCIGPGGVGKARANSPNPESPSTATVHPSLSRGRAAVDREESALPLSDQGSRDTALSPHTLVGLSRSAKSSPEAQDARLVVPSGVDLFSPVPPMFGKQASLHSKAGSAAQSDQSVRPRRPHADPGSGQTKPPLHSTEVSPHATSTLPPPSPEMGSASIAQRGGNLLKSVQLSSKGLATEHTGSAGMHAHPVPRTTGRSTRPLFPHSRSQDSGKQAPQQPAVGGSPESSALSLPDSQAASLAGRPRAMHHRRQISVDVLMDEGSSYSSGEGGPGREVRGKLRGMGRGQGASAVRLRQMYGDVVPDSASPTSSTGSPQGGPSPQEHQDGLRAVLAKWQRFQNIVESKSQDKLRPGCSAPASTCGSPPAARSHHQGASNMDGEQWDGQQHGDQLAGTSGKRAMRRHRYSRPPDSAHGIAQSPESLDSPPAPEPAGMSQVEALRLTLTRWHKLHGAPHEGSEGAAGTDSASSGGSPRDAVLLEDSSRLKLLQKLRRAREEGLSDGGGEADTGSSGAGTPPTRQEKILLANGPRLSKMNQWQRAKSRAESDGARSDSGADTPGSSSPSAAAAGSSGGFQDIAISLGPRQDSSSRLGSASRWMKSRSHAAGSDRPEDLQAGPWDHNYGTKLDQGNQREGLDMRSAVFNRWLRSEHPLEGACSALNSSDAASSTQDGEPMASLAQAPSTRGRPDPVHSILQSQLRGRGAISEEFSLGGDSAGETATRTGAKATASAQGGASLHYTARQRTSTGFSGSTRDLRLGPGHCPSQNKQDDTAPLETGDDPRGNKSPERLEAPPPKERESRTARPVASSHGRAASSENLGAMDVFYQQRKSGSAINSPSPPHVPDSQDVGGHTVVPGPGADTGSKAGARMPEGPSVHAAGRAAAGRSPLHRASGRPPHRRVASVDYSGEAWATAKPSLSPEPTPVGPNRHPRPLLPVHRRVASSDLDSSRGMGTLGGGPEGVEEQEMWGPPEETYAVGKRGRVREGRMLGGPLGDEESGGESDRSAHLEKSTADVAARAAARVRAAGEGSRRGVVNHRRSASTDWMQAAAPMGSAPQEVGPGIKGAEQGGELPSNSQGQIRGAKRTSGGQPPAKGGGLMLAWNNLTPTTNLRPPNLASRRCPSPLRSTVIQGTTSPGQADVPVTMKAELPDDDPEEGGQQQSRKEGGEPRADVSGDSSWRGLSDRMHRGEEPHKANHCTTESGRAKLAARAAAKHVASEVGGGSLKGDKGLMIGYSIRAQDLEKVLRLPSSSSEAGSTSDELSAQRARGRRPDGWQLVSEALGGGGIAASSSIGSAGAAKLRMPESSLGGAVEAFRNMPLARAHRMDATDELKEAQRGPQPQLGFLPSSNSEKGRKDPFAAGLAVARRHVAKLNAQYLGAGSAALPEWETCGMLSPETKAEIRALLNPLQGPKSHCSHILGKPYKDVRSSYAFHRKQLGAGRFGVIRKCKELASGRVYACKSISKGEITCSEEADDVRTEIACLTMMRNHPEVVQIKGTFEDRENVHIIMELCRGGDLCDRIASRRRIAEPDAAKVCQALIRALIACHSLGIMHRDVKPENVLLVSEDSEHHVKLVDFGVSALFRKGEPLTHIAGTLEFMAPEVLRKNYGPEADIWSAGVLMYIALIGLQPFWASSKQGLMECILEKVPNFKSDKWLCISPQGKELVQRMLIKDPMLRITGREILVHPWIKMFCEP